MAGRSRSKRTKVRGNSTKAQFAPGLADIVLETVRPQLPNFMTNPEMSKAAMLLAKLALGDNFIPKEFFRDDATALLKENGWGDPQKLDPVQRLIDNGILKEWTAGGFSRLRFVLDPIGENLAAAHYVRTCRRDAECMNKLKDDAAKAPGFLAAVELFGSAML
jgi:hypothetical protein